MASISTVRFLSNTLINSLASVTALGLNTLVYFILTPIFLNQWGATQYGIYVLIISITPMVLILGEMGFQGPIAKAIAQHLTVGDEERVRKLSGTVNLGFVGLGLGSGLLLLSSPDVVADLLGVSVEMKEVFVASLRITALTCAFSLAVIPLVGFFEGLQRYLTLRLIDVSQPILLFAAVMTLYWSGRLTVKNVAAVLAFLAILRFSVLLVRASQVKVWKAVSIHLASLDDVLKMTRWLSVSRMASFAVKRADPFIAVQFIGEIATGNLAIIKKVGDLPGTFRTLSSSALVPFASELDARQRHDAIEELFIRGSRLTVVLGLGPLVALAVYGPQLYEVWLGQELSWLGNLLRLLLVSILIESVLSFGAGIIIGKGDVRELVLISLLNGTCKIVLSIILAMMMGITGILLGTLVGNAAAIPGHLKLFRRHFPVAYKHFFREVVFKPMGLAVIVIIVFLAPASTIVPSFPIVLCLLLVTTCSYWLMSLILCLPQEDRVLLHSHFKTLGLKLAKA